MNLRLSLLSFVAAACCATAPVSAAEFENPREFSIPAQSLSSALMQFAQQSSIQVLTESEVLDGYRSRGVKGKVTAIQALEALLQGTGLSFRKVGEGTVAVRRGGERTGNGAGKAPAGKETALVPIEEALRLAQAGAAVPPPVSPSVATGAAGPREAQKMETELVVTGTHIRGSDNSTAPLIVMDREFIDATGVTSTSQLIESLPQNFALANQSVPSGGVLTGISFSSLAGSSINLRGLGEGTTLTLVNGRRMPLGYDGSAVNIVAIPLPAVERVEVLTDGASALYGSDAVGGVVNFILRKEFDGAESRVHAGFADGYDEQRLSQSFGRHWRGGSLAVGADYYRSDLLKSAERDFVNEGIRSTIGSLLPRDRTLALTLFARQDLSDDLELFTDVLYTDRDSMNRNSHIFTVSEDRTNYTDSQQLSGTVGLGWTPGGQWRAELSVAHGRDDMELEFFDTAGFTAYGLVPVLAKFTGADIKADGPLFMLPGGAVRLAAGASWREESLDSSGFNADSEGNVLLEAGFYKQRRVKSLFSEALLPLVGADNARQMLRRLELSLAGRYDEYSDFGSSFDPRVGLAWAPSQGLKFRAALGTSYVTPKLKDYDTAFNAALAVADFAEAGGMHTLIAYGNNVTDLTSQESQNRTVGFDWAPASLPGATFGVNYYDILYKRKIEEPALPLDLVLSDPDTYGDLVILNPSPAQIEFYINHGLSGGQGFIPVLPDFSPNPDFQPSDVELIVDYRRSNIGVVRTRGIDVSAAYDFQAGGGEMRLGLDGSYILKLEKQLTATSAPFSTRDTFGSPTRLHLRAQMGYRKGRLSFNSFVHRKNAYTDNRFAPFVDIGSYSTVDANLAWRFDDAAGLLADATLGVGALNLFDRDPPSTRIRPTTGQFDLGFDATNASPLGRLWTLNLSKRW